MLILAVAGTPKNYYLIISILMPISLILTLWDGYTVPLLKF